MKAHAQEVTPNLSISAPNPTGTQSDGRTWVRFSSVSIVGCQLSVQP